MVAEIRRAGNKLVLYTDDESVYRFFNKWKYTDYKTMYAQKGKIVAADFYIDWKFEPTVRMAIKGQIMMDM